MKRFDIIQEFKTQLVRAMMFDEKSYREMIEELNCTYCERSVLDLLIDEMIEDEKVYKRTRETTEAVQNKECESSNI